MFDKQDRHESELTRELAAVESQLRHLTPTAPRIDRDRFMFEAGRAAVRPEWPGYIAGPSWAGPRAQFWPTATALMTAASLLLATMLVWQNWPRSAVQPAANPQASDVAHAARNRPGGQKHEFASRDIWPTMPASSGYLGIRYIALTKGVAAIPSDFSSSTEPSNRSEEGKLKPMTARGLLHEMMPAPSGSNPTRS